MSRATRAVAVALTGLLLLGAQTAPGGTDIQVVDLSNYPLARIVFSPPEEARDTELTPADVTLTQDGEPVEFILRALEAEPVEAVLVIDTSGSMAGAPLAAAQDAAIGFIEQMPSGSDISVVAFGTEVAVVAEFGTTPEDVAAAIASLVATGQTSLYDAVDTAIAIADAGPRARQFIIVLSDGADTASTNSLDETLESLAGIDVGFFAVALQSAEFDSSALQEMADTSDGVVAVASQPGALADVYADIATELVSQYSVVFEPLTDGTATFDLTVSTPSGPSSDDVTVDLPSLAGAGTGGTGGFTTTTMAIPDITTAPPREVSPPPTRVVGEPGRFAQEWAFTVGIGALAVVLLLALLLALKPQGERRQRRSGVFDPDQANERRGPFPVLRARLASRLESFARQRSDRAATGVESALDAAGVALKPGEFVFISTIGVVLGFLLGLALGNFVLAVVLVAVAVLGPRLWLQLAATRRRAAFADQLEGTLQLIAGSLRAGYGVGQAINTVATESAEPTQSEFARVVVEARLGRDFDEALKAMAERMENQDLRWVTDAIEIQRGVGGDLAEVLDKVSSTIRDRNQVRRQVQALTAEGRLSAIILIGLPFALAGFISITNPDYLGVLTTTTAGRLMLLGGAVLMTLGVIWIRRLIKIEF